MTNNAGAQTLTIAELSAMVATLAQDLSDLAAIVYAAAVEETGPPTFIETLHRIADDAARIQAALHSPGADRA
jgi:hypothetical protein